MRQLTISASACLNSPEKLILPMLSLKAFLILAILAGGIAAGSAVYSIWNDENFAAELRVLSATADGNDIIMDVQLTMENKMDSALVLKTLKVTILNEDKTVVLVSEVLAPPQIYIGAHSTVVKIVQVRLSNIDALGTTVFGIIDVQWTSGSDSFSLHRELPLDITAVL